MVTLGQLPRPFVVGVVVERSAAAAAGSSGSAFRAGAHAVELNLASLSDGEQPDRAFFSRLRKPVYTSCRRAAFMEVYGTRFVRLTARTDEARMERQLTALARGSVALDIEADTFAPAGDEWTRDRGAIQRQSELAVEARRGGGEAVFSWHPQRKLTLAEALRAASALRGRGADFVKIIERVRNVREALDSAFISLRLRDALEVPFVFLPLGPGAEQVRPYMTAFGAAYLLARPPSGSNRLAAQPLVERAVGLAGVMRPIKAAKPK